MIPQIENRTSVTKEDESIFTISGEVSYEKLLLWEISHC